MSVTPILAIPQVAPNQNQKESTINTGLSILEAAMNDSTSIDMSVGDYLLTGADYNRNFHLIFSGQTQARVAEVPANVRWFAATNQGAHNITIRIDGQAFAGVTVEPGSTVLYVSTGTAIVAVTAGVSTIFNLSDVDGSQTPSAGQTLVWDGARFIAGDRPADIAVDVRGAPAANEVITRRVFARSVQIPTSFILSQGVAATAATAATDFDVRVNGASVGSISFAAAASTATFVSAASITIASGDVLEIVAPASPDATLADINLALWATYI